MRAASLLASLAMLALTAGTAYSGPITDHATDAEALLDEGDPVAAVEALDKAMEEIWNQSPLVFRKVLFVEDLSGFGLYRERQSEVFKPGEPLVVYAEPIGFAYGRNNAGGTEISLIADFVLTDLDNKELFVKDDFLNVTLPVRYHNREFQIKMTVNLSGLPVGKYVAKFHMRDKYSDKSGDFEMPFEIAE